MRSQETPEHPPPKERETRPKPQKEEKRPELEKREEITPIERMNFLERIRAKFRDVVKSFSGSKDELIDQMDEELTQAEKEATRHGVNFAKCQMDKVIEEYMEGRQMEFDCFSPYLADYNTSTGKFWEDKLTKTDAAGLEIASMLRGNFPKARMVCLYDEYNSDLSDTGDVHGKPQPGPQITFSDETKKNFRKSLEETLQNRGIIKSTDKDNKDYLFIAESDKIRDAELLVERLEKEINSEGESYIKRNGEEIIFQNPNAENPEYQEFTLRTKKGRWLCEALDAASYLKPENLEIIHLVILPNHFKKQQDKVWEMLRVLGIKPLRYHNIFYDENVSPEIITQTITEEINKYK